MLEMPRRIVAGGELRPEEYDARITFEGWETEDGTDQTGWDVVVHDEFHQVDVLVRFYGHPLGGKITAQILARADGKNLP